MQHPVSGIRDPASRIWHLASGYGEMSPSLRGSESSYKRRARFGMNAAWIEFCEYQVGMAPVVEYI